MPAQTSSGGAALQGTFPQRLRQVAAYARQLSPADQKALIAELETGSLQDQQLAGVAAVSTQSAEWVEKHITDSMFGLQHLALRYSHLIPDEAIERTLARDLSDYTRKAIVRYGLNKRPQLADKLFPETRKTWGDRLAVRVLVHCSPETVEKHLQNLLPSALATSTWTQLANNHSEVLLSVLEKSLDEADQSGIERQSWWNVYGVAVAALLKAVPSQADRVLDMVEKHKLSAFPPLLNTYLSAFARLAPARMLEYLCKPKWFGRRHGFSRHSLRRITRSSLGRPALIKYAESFVGSSWGCKAVLESLAPRDRLPIYKAMKLDGEHLDLLPRQHQAELAAEKLEKQKHLEVSRISELTTVSYLKPEDAQPKLQEYMMDPDMTVRCKAISLFVQNASRSRSSTVWNAALVKLAFSMRNQPQPVREPVIRTMCNVPPLTWTTESLAAMDKIGKDALDAPDHCSAMSHLASFALDTMRSRPEFESWCLELLQKLNKEKPVYLHENVRHGQVLKVYEALAPDLEAGMSKKKFDTVYTVANWVGKRLKDIPGLQQLLYDITQHKGAYEYHASSALQLLVEVDKSYAVKALRDERSTLNFKPVADVIAKDHPELLDLGNPPKGRWLEDTTDWTFCCKPSLSKYWPEDQVKVYLDQLKRDVETGDIWNRAERMRKLKHVPGGLTTAKAYTLDDNVRVAEAALSVLANDPKELPTLLSYATTDSARVAMFCAARAAKHVPTSVVLPMLEEVLAGEKTKITSKKQVLRLIARLSPVDTAARVLSAAATAPTAHRDVITAVTSVALEYLLPTPTGWDIVESSASMNKQASLAVAGRSPLVIGDRSRFAKLVTSLAASADEDVASMALLNIGNWASFSPEAWSILKNAITDMKRRKVWESAVKSLTSRAGGPKGMEVLCDTLAALLSTKEEPEADAGEFDDLPVSRRVQFVTQYLCSFMRDDPAQYEKTQRAALKTIDSSGNINYTQEYCDVLLSLWKVDPGVLDTIITRLNARPVLAGRFAEDLANRLLPAEALKIAPKLAMGGYTEALFAVSLASRMGPRTKWEKDWQDIVRQLRAHENEEIRDLARHIKAVYYDNM